MRIDARWIVTALLFVLLGGAAAAADPDPAAPASDSGDTAADDEATADDDASAAENRKWGRLYVEENFWFVQPTGLEYTPAVIDDPAFPLDRRVLDVPQSAKPRDRMRVAWVLPQDMGEIVGTYVSLRRFNDLVETSPGSYVYGETQAFPLFAGVWDDGLADGFVAKARTELREMRVDFARKAFDSSRFRATWFAGLRRVNHKSDLTTTYYSLVQPPELFPPILPPLGNRTDLAPLPDVTKSISEYEARGVEAGIDFEFPFGRGGKFAIEGGLAIAALRGTLHTVYQSTTHAYAVAREGQPLLILAAPFDEFAQDDPNSPNPNEPIPLLASIIQVDFPLGLVTTSASHGSSAIETHLGFRWRPWKGLSVFAGMRDVRYENAGEVVRPTQATITPSGTINVQSFSRTSVSPTYEGFYAGVGYLF